MQDYISQGDQKAYCLQGSQRFYKQQKDLLGGGL